MNFGKTTRAYSLADDDVFSFNFPLVRSEIIIMAVYAKITLLFRSAILPKRENKNTLVTLKNVLIQN